jgi:hypothetical protein
MAYIECPKCGYKALSVATRCPRCGHDFPTQLIRHPVSESQIHKLWPVLILAGVLVTVVVIDAVVRRQAVPRAITPSPVMPTLDSAVYVPTQTVRETTVPSGDSSRAVEPPLSGIPPTGGPGSRRYATTWVNVREHRSGGTAAVRVLNPGEAVLVDSLSGGWYRVVADGRTVGYVDRLYLDTAPPPTLP